MSADEIPSAVEIRIDTDKHPAENVDAIIEGSMISAVQSYRRAEAKDEDSEHYILLAAELNTRLTQPRDIPEQPSAEMEDIVDDILRGALTSLKQTARDSPDLRHHAVAMMKEFDARIKGGDA